MACNGMWAQDQRVRDGVLEALMHDSSAQVRTAAIGLLEPVQSDSSVRQVLRTVSTQDENPYIRTASFHALQSAADIQYSAALFSGILRLIFHVRRTV